MKSPVARLFLYFGLAALVVGLMTASGCVSNKAPVIVSLEAGKTSVSILSSTALRIVAYDPDGDEMSYEWQASDGTLKANGDRATWTSPQTAATHAITVKVRDSRGAEVEGKLDITVTPDTPPVITSLTPSRTQISRGEEVVIDCVATDAEQDSLSYDWSATDGSFTRSGPVAIWKAPATLGNSIITVVVSDGKGGEASSDVTIVVATNQPPVIKSLTSKDAVVVYGKSTALTCEAFDADADDLTYVWTAAEGTITGEGATVEWASPDVCGQFVPITVTVLDGRGGEADAQITLQTRKPG